VIKWPVKLYVRFFTFFFKIQKNMTFYVFLSCCTRFPEQWLALTKCIKTGCACFRHHDAVYFKLSK